MKRVILDEGVPEGLAEYLPEYEVHSVRSLGWKSVVNGKLLKLIDAANPDAFITADKNMQRQNNLLNRPYKVLLLSTNHWPQVRRNVEAVKAALDEAKLGEITLVDVGRFIPTRHRTLAP